MNLELAKKIVSVAENLASERDKCFELEKVTNDKKFKELAHEIMKARGNVIDYSEKLGIKWYWSENNPMKSKDIGTGLLLAEFEGVELTKQQKVNE